MGTNNLEVQDSLPVRYRPRKLKDLCGNQDNIKVLSGFIENRKLVKAYLLCGAPGSGKTTSARILAQILNCQNLQGSEPCMKCTSCKMMISGNHPDIHEINLAGEAGKVDNVRRVLDLTKYQPRFNFRIIIGDECFIGETKVITETGEQCIKDLVECKEDVKIKSYNKATDLVEFKSINNRFSKHTEELLEITLEDNSVIECTPNHRFFVEGKGWVKAKNLSLEDELKDGRL